MIKWLIAISKLMTMFVGWTGLLVQWAWKIGTWQLKTLWNAYQAFDKIGSLVVGLILTVLVFMFDQLGSILEMMASMESGSASVGGVSGSVLPVGNGQILAVLNVINNYIPLSEFVSLVIVLFGVWVFAVSFRLIKSWLPTVN
jgi:hypothetical protein